MPDGETDASAQAASATIGAAIGVSRLKKRRDFLAAAKARKWATPGFVLQGRRRRPDEAADGPRVGFTASKKVGNAVKRNRAKRRLRALCDAVVPETARPDWDYVLIARAETTATRPFTTLRAELLQAMERIHRDKADGRGGAKSGRSRGARADIGAAERPRTLGG